MTTVIVRYKVKKDRAGENIRLVEAVFAELKDKKAEGLRYAAFVAEDGVTFFHVAAVDDGVENPLFQTEAFKAFQKDIADRCDTYLDPPRSARWVPTTFSARRRYSCESSCITL